jgi:hypothetical protein
MLKSFSIHCDGCLSCRGPDNKRPRLRPVRSTPPPREEDCAGTTLRRQKTRRTYGCRRSTWHGGLVHYERMEDTQYARNRAIGK